MVRATDEGGPVIGKVFWYLFDAAVGALVGVIASRRRSPCARDGHTWRRHDAPTRIFLRCDLCGLESPGWQLFERPPGCERLEPRR